MFGLPSFLTSKAAFLLAGAAVAGFLYWKGYDTASDLAEAQAAVERLKRARVIAEAQALDQKKVTHALEQQAAAERARSASLTLKLAEIDKAEGACLDEQIPADLLRALGSDGVRPDGN